MENKTEMTKEEMELANELIDLKQKIESCKNLQEAQMFQLPFSTGEGELYMVGLYNGMELVNAILEGRRPEFCGVTVKEPEGGQKEELKEELTKEDMEATRTIAGSVKKG